MPASQNDMDAFASIKQTLEERFPDQGILDIRSSAIPGLFEVYSADDSIAYTDASADHLFVGSLLDTRTRRNIVADRLDERHTVDFKTLPFKYAIKTVKGTGQRQLAAFTDPDCPACEQLEKDLVNVSDITIYTFLFPVAELHPQAPAHARAIWCASDRPGAWRQWMLERQAPHSAKCPDDPIQQLHALAEKLRIRGTPTLFLSNGRRITGGVDIARLEQLMNESQVGAAG